jgi:tetratricopeptide (TPR) repeat protein
LHAARNAEPGAGDALAALIRNTQTPAIARATAMAEMGPHLSVRTVDVLTQGLSDEDARVREATVSLLDYTPAEMRVRLAFPMLDDPVRAVRIEAARQLAAFPTGTLDAEQQAALEKGLQEFIKAQYAMAERPEAQTHLGNLYAARGDLAKAVTAYETAIELDPAYVPGYVNLADLYRAQGDEAQAEKVLRRAVVRVPESADLHHVLGLSLVRQQRTEEAVQELKRATILNPQSARYVYVYAVALNSTGKPEQAIMILQGAHTAHPNNRDILSALAAFHRDSGNEAAARSYAQKLGALSP